MHAGRARTSVDACLVDQPSRLQLPAVLFVEGPIELEVATSLYPQGALPSAIPSPAEHCMVARRTLQRRPTRRTHFKHNNKRVLVWLQLRGSAAGAARGRAGRSRGAAACRDRLSARRTQELNSSIPPPPAHRCPPHAPPPCAAARHWRQTCAASGRQCVRLRTGGMLRVACRPPRSMRALCCLLSVACCMLYYPASGRPHRSMHATSQERGSSQLALEAAHQVLPSPVDRASPCTCRRLGIAAAAGQS